MHVRKADGLSARQFSVGLRRAVLSSCFIILPTRIHPPPFHPAPRPPPPLGGFHVDLMIWGGFPLAFPPFGRKGWI